jgi:hypothetical protein
MRVLDVGYTHDRSCWAAIISLLFVGLLQQCKFVFDVWWFRLGCSRLVIPLGGHWMHRLQEMLIITYVCV